MSACPICATSTERRHAVATVYFECPECGLLFQDPPPPKTLHGAHEAPPQGMGEGEKRINEALAQWLFADVMNGKPGRTLDIGAAFPWLAHSLWKLGGSAAGMEPDPAAARWHDELHVQHFPYDFEDWNPRPTVHIEGSFDLVSTIHSWEHMYRPLDAMRKVRQILAPSGAWFIRMPDSRVPGHERDFTEGHYSIHPYVHTLTCVLQCCAETGCFVVAWDRPLVPGQRDLILRVTP